MTISVQLEDADRVFDQIERALGDVLEQAVARGAEVIAFAARASHPYTDRSYDLTRSIKPMPVTVVNDTQAVGGVEADMDYASYVDEGTTRMEARPFLAPAAARTDEMLDRELGRLLREAIARGAS